ncbi:hypothetical protein APSETT444_007354 [Aspergillus pseudonomiae]
MFLGTARAAEAKNGTDIIANLFKDHYNPFMWERLMVNEQICPGGAPNTCGYGFKIIANANAVQNQLRQRLHSRCRMPYSSELKSSLPLELNSPTKNWL